MKEVDRTREMLREMVAADVDEEITAIGWFDREGGSENSWRHGPRLLRRVRARRSDQPADHLGSRNVLALTPTRVIVFAGRVAPPLVRVHGLVGAWALSEVTVQSRAHTSQASMSRAGGTYERRGIRVTLSFAGGEHPLGMDFRRDELAREVVAALKASAGAPSAR